MPKRPINPILMLIALLVLVAMILACTPESQESEQNTQGLSTLEIHHAKLFSISYHEGYKKITVHRTHRNAGKSEMYYLFEGSEIPPGIPQGAMAIAIPLRSVAVTSTSHLPHLELINQGHTLSGFPGLDLISSAYFRERAELGQLIDIGRETGLNKEKLIELQPELVIGYTLGTNLDTYYDLSRLGIPVAFNAEYLEETPLGRAEWIKFFAAFYNAETMADSVFREIESKYLELKTKAAGENNRPSIISGVMYGDTWFAPGGQSWAAKFFQDAGGNYLWSDNEVSGSLELSIEAMLERGIQAEKWIGIANFRSREELRNSQSRYRHFTAFEQGALYTYTKRQGAKGGNDYLELGYARPDLILADLVSILHPKLLPNYETVFFEQLKP